MMLKKTRLTKLLLLGISLLSIMIVLGGCGSHGSQINPPGSTSRPMADVVLYYADSGANYLVPEIRKVDEEKFRTHPARTAIEMLLAGTENPNLVNVIPPGTKLNGISIHNRTAYVDFNENLLTSTGSTTEIFIVGSIANTLTEFSTIDQVQILVGGKKITTISGHMDVSSPLGRSERIIKK